MFCKKCGTMLHADATQCSNCGEPAPPKPVVAPPTTTAVLPQYAPIRRKDSSFWIALLRFCAWALFAAIVIAGIAIGVVIGQATGGISWSGVRSFNPGPLFFFIPASVIIGLFTVAGIMTALDAASDIRTIKNMLAEKLHRDEPK